MGNLLLLRTKLSNWYQLTNQPLPLGVIPSECFEDPIVQNLLNIFKSIPNLNKYPEKDHLEYLFALIDAGINLCCSINYPVPKPMRSFYYKGSIPVLKIDERICCFVTHTIKEPNETTLFRYVNSSW